MAKAVWSADFINLSPIRDEKGVLILRVPWLDFIRKWSKLSHENNPFSRWKNMNTPEEWQDPTRMLILSSYFPVVGSNGQSYPAQELYFAKQSEQHDWTGALVFAVLVDNTAGRVRIELFKEEYREQTLKFMKELYPNG